MESVLDSVLAKIKMSGVSYSKLSEISGVHLRTLENWLYSVDPNPRLKNLEQVLSSMGYGLFLRRVEND